MSKRVITFGTWNGAPIEWLVLKKDNFQVLLISKSSLFAKQFNSSNNNYWNTSTLCSFLNKEFWNTAFTTDEKKMVINTHLIDVASKNNVFILSYDESRNLFNGNDERKTISSSRWWLRSQNESHVWGVDTDGLVDRKFSSTETQSVHPAIYIRKR